ncbi:MAG: DUF86 domain-containing protein [Rhodobacter sp.]|nr:DUF86 domain-containing protein [Rhodobacter sp.]
MVSQAERDDIRIGHMLDAIAGVRATVGSEEMATVFADWTRARAIERGYEIISEASRHVSDNAKATEPQIDWRWIAGIWNVLRHDHDGVEISILFRAIAAEFPVLEAALLRMRARLMP